MKTKLTLLIIFILTAWFTVQAQQLTYKPANPNFGGNYLNYSWLLSSANAQNPYDDSTLSMNLNNSPVSGFSDSIKRQILNQLTRNLFGGGASGEGGNGGFEPGSFEIGGLYITIDNTRSGSIITIIDIQTGETTEIII